MGKYKALAVAAEYWRPGDDFVDRVVSCVEGRIIDGDFIVVSEKAISTASNNIVDERLIESGMNSFFIAKYWMQIIWGHILGPLCNLNERLLRHLREYPVGLGSRHKQAALQYSGLFQALMFGSEGGIDGSNLAYAYVSLPLRNADEIAERIRQEIQSSLKRKVFVMIVDTDKTYSFRNFHFTSRPNALKEIHSLGGFIAYVIGRLFNLDSHPSPVGLAGCRIDIEETLRIAEIANYLRGAGTGRTVWDMSERFGVDLVGVSWEMLETVRHKPIVIVRKKER